jgi:NAD(P)-dependent dehydrogenase (short-subunit alcohol dehydrogenase family)
VTYRARDQEAAEVAEAVEAAGGRAIALPLDLSSPRSIEEAPPETIRYPRGRPLHAVTA